MRERCLPLMQMDVSAEHLRADNTCLSSLYQLLPSLGCHEFATPVAQALLHHLLCHNRTLKQLMLAGSITLESFFKRIPKQEQHPPPGAAAWPLPGRTAQHAGAARGVLQEGAGLGSMLARARGHAEDSTQERRERILRAAQQRIDRLVRCCAALCTTVHCAAARSLRESPGCPKTGAG